MDAATLLDPDANLTERAAAASSLWLSLETAGWGPNAGAVRLSAQLIPEGTSVSRTTRLLTEAEDAALGEGHRLSVRAVAEDGMSVGQQQGRQGRIEQLQLMEFDPNQPSHVRGWLRQERREIERGRRSEPRVPNGYELGHRPATPASEGYDYSNTDLTLTELNRMRPNRRRSP